MDPVNVTLSFDDTSDSMLCSNAIDRALQDAGIDVSCPNEQQLRPLLKIGHDVNRQFGYTAVASICRRCTVYLNNHNVHQIHPDDLLLIWDVAVTNVYGSRRLAPFDIVANLPVTEFEIAVARRERIPSHTVSKTDLSGNVDDNNITLPYILVVVMVAIAILVVCTIT